MFILKVIFYLLIAVGVIVTMAGSFFVVLYSAHFIIALL